MRQHLLDFLKALEESVPPPSGQHHAITYAQYGCDELGWEDRLALSVRNPERNDTRIVFLDDGDLEKPAAELIAEVVEILERG